MKNSANGGFVFLTAHNPSLHPSRELCVVKQSRKFVFTDRKIERLSADLLCGRKQLEFTDEPNAGLRVMLYKSGNEDMKN